MKVEKNIFQNFPRIPKIALRKSCDEFKDMKDIDSNFFDIFFPILITFSHVLGLPQLIPWFASQAYLFVADMLSPGKWDAKCTFW